MPILPMIRRKAQVQKAEQSAATKPSGKRFFCFRLLASWDGTIIGKIWKRMENFSLPAGKGRENGLSGSGSARLWNLEQPFSFCDLLRCNKGFLKIEFYYE